MKTCFVIAPIGEQGSETRRRSDIVLKYIITPAMEQCGYTPLRADQISEPGLITSQVIQHIVDDPLVIADLTDRNPNVFYELAIRHALRKPLVQIIKKGEQIPFDVAGTRTISVDHHDLESVEEAKNEIIRQIESIEKSTQDIETPISVAIELQSLKQSDKPEERSLADIVSAISEIKTGITSIQKVVSDNPEMSKRSLMMMEELYSRTREYSYIQREMLERMDSFLKQQEQRYASIEEPNKSEQERKSVKK